MGLGEDPCPRCNELVGAEELIVHGTQCCDCVQDEVERLRPELADAKAACLVAYRAWVQPGGSSQFVKDEASHLLIDVVRPSADTEVRMISADASDEIRIVVSGIGAVTKRGYEWINLQDEVERLRAQLPPEMPDCTIVFNRCEYGHGWLTATNWVQIECPTCQIQRLKEIIAGEAPLRRALLDTKLNEGGD